MAGGPQSKRRESNSKHDSSAKQRHKRGRGITKATTTNPSVSKLKRMQNPVGLVSAKRLIPPPFFVHRSSIPTSPDLPTIGTA